MNSLSRGCLCRLKQYHKIDIGQGKARPCLPADIVKCVEMGQKLLIEKEEIRDTGAGFCLLLSAPIWEFQSFFSIVSLGLACFSSVW